jgi:hypothetical protein
MPEHEATALGRFGSISPAPTQWTTPAMIACTIALWRSLVLLRGFLHLTVIVAASFTFTKAGEGHYEGSFTVTFYGPATRQTMEITEGRFKVREGVQ